MLWCVTCVNCQSNQMSRFFLNLIFMGLLSHFFFLIVFLGSKVFLLILNTSLVETSF